MSATSDTADTTPGVASDDGRRCRHDLLRSRRGHKAEVLFVTQRQMFFLRTAEVRRLRVA